MAVSRPQPQAARTRGTVKRPRVHWSLKLSSILGAFLTAVLGVQTIFQGAQAGNDSKITKLITWMEAQSYGSYDINQTGTILLVTVILTAVSSTCGCVGAMADQQCALAFFGLGAMALGFIVLTICACMGVYLRSQSPVVSKSVNRICQPGAPTALKTGLANFCTRRLQSEDATILPSLSKMLPRSLSSTLIAGALSTELFGTAGIPLGPEVVNGTAVRRLMPSTAEESMILRTCSRLGSLCTDPCDLIDELCVEPDGFDPLTACICDRQGPRAHQYGSPGLIPARCPRNDQSPMCKLDGSNPPNKLGVYCMSPKPNLAEADLMTELVGGFEACFVLPSADCSSRGGTVPRDCNTAGEEPCISAGPCIDPDSRSKLFVESREAAFKFVQVAAVLGTFACLAATFALCMCCQIHTGASILDHAVRLTQARPRTFKSENRGFLSGEDSNDEDEETEEGDSESP